MLSVPALPRQANHAAKKNSALVHTVKFVKSVAIRIFCRIMLPCPCSNFAQNVIIHLFMVMITSGKFHRNLFSIRAKRIKNATVGAGHRDRQRDIVKYPPLRRHKYSCYSIFFVASYLAAVIDRWCWISRAMYTSNVETSYFTQLKYVTQ